MNYEDQHPQIIIYDKLYNIDFKKQELACVGHPDNRIAFNTLVKKDDFYWCGYDGWGLENYYASKGPTIAIPARVIDNTTPYDKVFAAEFNAEIYKRTLAEMRFNRVVLPKMNISVLLIDEKIQKRLNGQLPTIDIAGSPFVVDWHMKELRSEEDPAKKIQLWYIETEKTENPTYYTFYHVPSQKTLEIPRNVLEVPKDVVLLAIPNEVVLDPVGVAIRSGKNPVKLLRNYPIQENLKAEVTPINKTWVPLTVERNLKKISQATKQANTTKKKRGHGL